jgi:hypothetical protein
MNTYVAMYIKENSFFAPDAVRVVSVRASDEIAAREKLEPIRLGFQSRGFRFETHDLTGGGVYLLLEEDEAKTQLGI